MLATRWVERNPFLQASSRREPGPSSPSTPRVGRRAARVLVVEDSNGERRLLSRVFSRAGYEVVEAADGNRAWTLLQGDSFDVMVSDVEMPGMDGFELLRRVRASDLISDLLVVLNTSLERSRLDTAALAGADAYVTKHGSRAMQSLLREVEQLTAREEGRRC